MPLMGNRDRYESDDGLPAPEQIQVEAAYSQQTAYEQLGQGGFGRRRGGGLPRRQQVDVAEEQIVRPARG